ncbi:transcriptional regulator [Lactobacillus helveticus]|uniref:LysR family transcriptional regulator substrate-binding protein n=1 Tax=Lactobacillus helveticus TaxID=1587 RepID=UPI001C64D37B|nr:LysR family transcriptional regulator substrate-binding protein [Lactobacillus helveticus]MBW8013497.1 transcriptional regulator [Lactobacillus helveticus]
MKKLRIAYFNQLGRRQLDRIVDQFKQKHSDVEIELIGMGHDEAFDKLAKNEVDLTISDLRDDQLDFKKEILGQEAVMAILQKGSYLSGVQMINKDDLADLTCFIVAKPEEEAAELHLFKDIYQIRSPFIASNSVEEAALLVASGSGYFLMNEATASLISNDTLQRLFLLSNGQQMWQKIAAFYTNEDAVIKDFILLAKKVY